MSRLTVNSYPVSGGFCAIRIVVSHAPVLGRIMNPEGSVEAFSHLGTGYMVIKLLNFHPSRVTKPVPHIHETY